MTRLIDVLEESAHGFEEACADAVRFRSPFTDYAGRPDVVHLVGLIRQVLDDVSITRQLAEGATTMTLFDAHVAGEEVQGVLYELRDDADRLVDAMLTVRPYAGLRAAMSAMLPLMEQSPLPSARQSHG